MLFMCCTHSAQFEGDDPQCSYALKNVSIATIVSTQITQVDDVLPYVSAKVSLFAHEMRVYVHL